MIRRRHQASITVIVMAAMIVAVTGVMVSHAGGPRSVNGSGFAMKWDTASPITYHPDPGALGLLSNESARELLNNAFQDWAAVLPGTVSFTQGTLLAEDVDATGVPASNTAHWKHLWRVDGDGLSPVIFDANGSIIDDMFGVGAHLDILGASGLDSPIALDPEITGASIVINGAFMDGLGREDDSPEDLVSPAAMQGVMLHEIGHFMNLDHSVVNHELANDGNAANDLYLPTMYPVEVDNEEAIADLNPDDVAAFTAIYSPPGPTLAGIEGFVFQDVTPFQGAGMVARRLDDPLYYAYSGISGARYFPCGAANPCGPEEMDQENLPALDTQMVNEMGTVGQTFVVGQAGLLTGIEISPLQGFALPSDEMVLELLDDVGTPLGQVRLSAAGFPPGPGPAASLQPDVVGPGFFDLSSLNVYVEPGPDYNFRLFTPPGTGGDMYVGSNFDGYPNGMGLENGVPNPTMDLLFKTFITLASHPVARGIYGIHGITAGDYTVCVDQIDTRFGISNGSFIGPLATPPIVPGPEECHDAAESGDPAADDPDVAQTVVVPAATTVTSIHVFLNSLPEADSYEPNNSLAAPRPVPALGAGDPQDTLPAVLPPGDLDVFSFSVAEGDIVRIDLEAAELGSSLDAVIGIYGPGDVLLALEDDALDPDSGRMSVDPARDFISTFSGTAKLVVSSYPDLDQDGLGGATSGPYWLRIRVVADSDGDGISDDRDRCPFDPLDDADEDGICAEMDLCPETHDPSQNDWDTDLVGDACDNCWQDANPGQADADLDGAGDLCDPCLLDPADDIDGDGLCANADNCPTVYNPAQGEPAKLSGTMPAFGDLVGTAGSIAISDDGDWVVYLADQNADTVQELYSTPFPAGTPVTRLNGGLISGGDVLSFKITPDSTEVVYLADQDTDGVAELYAVPIDGALIARKLNPALPLGGSVVTDYRVTSDGQYAIYRADQNEQTVVELWSVALSGGTVTRLHGEPVSEGDVQSFQVGDSGSLVVFRADLDTDGVDELYRVPAGSGTAVKVNDPLTTSGNVTQFIIGAGEETIVYMADQDTDEVFELYFYDIPGVASGKLNDPYGGAQDVTSYKMSPDGDMVVYRANQDTDFALEIYSVLSTGGGATKLNQPLPMGQDVLDYDISPDSTQVAYIADQEVGNRYELFVSPIIGGGNQKLNGALISGGRVWSFRFNPISSHVIYRADQEVVGQIELYSSYLLETARTKLNGPLVTGGDVFDASVISSDGLTVVYLADQDTDPVRELYGVPIFGGSPVKLNTPMVTGGGAGQPLLTPDDQGVIDPADQDTTGVIELFRTPLRTDEDADGIMSRCDVCDTVVDPAQGDYDGDGVGDFCDICPIVPDPGQEDLDGDGFGDACPPWVDGTAAPLGDDGLIGLGIAWGDYDSDGYPDVYVCNDGANKLFRNEGGGVFSDVTASPLNDAGSGAAAAWADYDNDGLLDLYLSNSTSANKLFKNAGDGSFVDVTPPVLAGVGLSQTAAWADFDRDGWVDLYLVNLGGANQLFKNHGDTIFSDVSAEPVNDAGPGRSAAWGDYNDDGLQDLYVTNQGAANKLFRNEGDGEFTDVTSAPLDDTGVSLGAAWGDYDEDGDLDLYVANNDSGDLLFRNEGGGSFIDATSLPLGDDSVGLNVMWSDVNLDGHLDILRTGPTRLFYGDGGGSWVEGTSAVLAAIGGGFGAGVADVDLDGDQDLLLTTGTEKKLILNDPLPVNGWLELKLWGLFSNTAAIGTIILVQDTYGAVQRRDISGGSGLWSQNSLTAHFGIPGGAGINEVLIRWPSGVNQFLGPLPVALRLDILEQDVLPPWVVGVFPPPGSQDVPVSTSVYLLMSEPVDSTTADSTGVYLVDQNGLKAPAQVSASSLNTLIEIDPVSALSTDMDYLVQVTASLTDPTGNGAIPFASSFDTSSSALGSALPSSSIGAGAGGSVVPGANVDDSSGFSTAVVGSVNGDAISELLTGAPNADTPAGIDAGKATLVFGNACLLNDPGACASIDYLGESAGQYAGQTVARAGDINDDGYKDFLIGAPLSDDNGLDAGKVFLVFGDPNLDEAALLDPNDPNAPPFDLSLIDDCTLSTRCGVAFLGEAAGDMAGAAGAFAGDINDDGIDDLLIGAPGADPDGSRVDGGKVYLIYGQSSFPAGTIQLSTVGVTTAGLVFHGEAAGDGAGGAVSRWQDLSVGGIDDLLIGAPLATVQDEFGAPLAQAGVVYAIHGGTTNLAPNPASPATIDLARVANGNTTPSDPDRQVSGYVFLGTSANGKIGRSVTGSVDLNGDGIPDVVIGGTGEVWTVSGDGPKTKTGTRDLKPPPLPSPLGLGRGLTGGSVMEEFDAAVFTPGGEGALGGATVAGTGDVNNDGYQDLIIGAPGVNVDSFPNAGKAYIVYGGPAPLTGELLLSDIGTTLSGQVVKGVASDDLFGASVSGGADVNGDGIDDACVGAPGSETRVATPPGGGETFVISPVRPLEVYGLTLAPTDGATVLEWNPAQSAYMYHVYRGASYPGGGDVIGEPIGPVYSSRMTQIACNVPGDSDDDHDGLPDTDDAVNPGTSTIFYYLVTGANLIAEGFLGPPEAFPQRVHDSQCP